MSTPHLYLGGGGQAEDGPR